MAAAWIVAGLLHALSAVPAELDWKFAQLDVLSLSACRCKIIEHARHSLIGNATVTIRPVDCEDLLFAVHLHHLRVSFSTVFSAGKSWMAVALRFAGFC